MTTLARMPRFMFDFLVPLTVTIAGCGDPSTSTASTASETMSGTGTAGTSTGTATGATTDEGVTGSANGTTGATASSTATESTSTGTTADPTTGGLMTGGLTTGSLTTGGTADTTGGPAECGNGVVEVGEECDDGNLVDGDGCESNCLAGAALCGNGMIDPGETCDDGNKNPDDGCASNCVTECGFLCLEPGVSCRSGFHAVQCATSGPPFGQASPLANACQLATLSVDGNYIALSPGTKIAGVARHLDGMYTDPSNAVFGFAGNTEDIAAGSQLVAVNTTTGELTPMGPNLGVWVMAAAMNDAAELWVTVFDTYERNATTQVRIAQVDPATGKFIDGPKLLMEAGMPVTVWSTHVSDVAFRFDGAMFVSANEPGPPPPEPLSRYLEVDRASATVLSSVKGPNDIYAAGIVFIGEDELIVAMDIRGDDDIFILDLSAPPTLNQSLLYPDPIPTNSGTADLAGCSKLSPQ